MTATELDHDTHHAIKIHCADGDAFLEENDYDAAIAAYNKAWILIPEPKNEWEAATWILVAIGDASFQAGYLTSARKAFDYVMTCPNSIGNPFIHLRRGEILFDQGEEDAAANELIRAYMADGDEIFTKENPKYLAFLRTRAEI